MLTYRDAKYVTARINGKSQAEALRGAGFSEALATHPQWVVTDEMRAEVERLQAELVKNQLEVGLIDAQELHQYLSDAVRADMRDIRNDDGSFKPQSEWPAIWGQMMEAGDCEIETEYDRSQDGEEKEKRGGWDAVGVVTKVKIKFSSRVKLIELAMKHKGVDAMVQQKQGDVNILMVTADKAREVSAARKRLAKVIDVAASTPGSDQT